MDYMIREFENNLIAMINGCQLPMEVKRLVLTNVLSQVREEANKLIIEQKGAVDAGIREDTVAE